MGLRTTLLTLALALYALAMAGIVSTEAYSEAAGSEARGVHALVSEVLAGGSHAELAVPREMNR